MIHSALQFLETFLNEELKKSLSLKDDVVIVSSLAHPDNAAMTAVKNKVAISIINIEKESVMKSQRFQGKSEGGQIHKEIPPMNLNLYVLVSSHLDDYLEALKRLSEVMRTFENHSYFTSKNASNVPANISKLTIEMYNMPISELSTVWSTMGAKYAPAVVYKVRMNAI